MKTLALFVIITAFLCFNLSASGELTVEDLEKISDIVDKAEARLQKHFTNALELQGRRIAEQGKRINDLIKHIDFQSNLIIALIVEIIVFVSVPMGILIYQFNKQT